MIVELHMPLWALALLLLSSVVAGDGSATYYCLEDYKPIGAPLQLSTAAAAANSSGSARPTNTSGQVARRCAAACDAAPECSGFRAVGPEVQGGGTCDLLTNSTQALPAALALQPKHPWPSVNANLTASDRVALRSVSWMCWRQQEGWDAFGVATHNLALTGDVAGAVDPSDSQWCAFGVDVAGTNLRRDTNITKPADCDPICNKTAGCSFWIYVASPPEETQFQPPFNCFSKADPFRGQNGWTGKPKADIWVADSQLTCFSSLVDWRHLGLVMSPSIKTIAFNGSYFTVYPERVMWAEAAAVCGQLPGGRLAVLNSQPLIDAVWHDLLDTLPFQTAIRSAWVGATGNNTAYDPNAPNITDLVAAGKAGGNAPAPRREPQQPNPTPPEDTLTWETGSKVPTSLLRRPDTLTQLWTVHDVVWSQQYVPDSSKFVCGRVIVQLPPSNGPVNPASVTPGLWYYDCLKPASFICQSSAAPDEPVNGREVQPGLLTGPSSSSSDSSSNRGGGGSGDGGSPAPWKTALAVILPVLVVGLLTYQVFHMYSRKMSRLPELIRQQRKRALGQPRSGRMSLVITDIQGFTRLMQESPDATTQALMLHNSIIKHATYENVGWVVEQEGDSFSVAFHEPEDAVAFTLQVQQALLQTPWPKEVIYGDSWEGATSFLECRTASHPEHELPDATTATTAVAEDGCSSQQGGPLALGGLLGPGGAQAAGQLGGTGQHMGSAAATGSAAEVTASQGSSASLSSRLAALGQQLLRLKKSSGPETRGSSSFTVGDTCGGGKQQIMQQRSHSMDAKLPSQQQQQQQQQLEGAVGPRVESTTSAGSSSVASAPTTPTGAAAAATGGDDAWQFPAGALTPYPCSSTGHGPHTLSAAAAAAAAATAPKAASVASDSTTRESWALGTKDSLGAFGWARSSDNNSNASMMWPSNASFATSAGGGGGTYSSGGGGGGGRKSSILGGARHRNMWLFHQLLSPRTEQQRLFNGLRVRMGVVTGVVERGQDLRSSELYRSAQAVSNAAHGGQVLLDESTFSAVKEALWRLAAVGPNGLDYDALQATRSAHRHSSSGPQRESSCLGDSCLAGLTTGGSFRREVSGISGTGQLSASASSDMAVAIDMGCYEVLPPHDTAHPNSRRAAQQQCCVQLWGRELGDKLVQQYQQYLQQQVSVHNGLGADEGRDSSFDEEAPYMVSPRRRSTNQQQQQLQGQQQSFGGGLASLRQLSAGSSRAPSAVFRAMGGVSPAASFGGGLGARPQLLQQGQQGQGQGQGGLVQRSAKSATLGGLPGLLSLGLFGVGVVPPSTAGAAGSMSDGLSIVSGADRHTLLGYCSISAVHRHSVRLYQIVAPSLAGRAALFGQKLELPRNWRVLDQPYFAAPGLSSASVAAAHQAELCGPNMLAAGGPPAAAAGGDVGAFVDQRGQRMPGRSSIESLPWQQQQQQSPGSNRRSSRAYKQQQQLSQLQQMRAASDTQLLLGGPTGRTSSSGALLPPTPPGTIAAPAAAAAATAAGPAAAPATGVDNQAYGSAAAPAAGEATAAPAAAGGSMHHSSSSPFLSAAQHRLSSSEGSAAVSDRDAATAAAAAAAAAAEVGAAPQSALQPAERLLDQQQQGQLLPLSLARFNSGSNLNGTTGQQQQQPLSPGAASCAPMSPTSPAAAGAGAAAAAAAEAASQSLLVLRAASLQLYVSPSAVGGSSGHTGDRGRGTGAGRSRPHHGPGRVVFPPVTILFAAVEGAPELLQHPAWARSVHSMVHHLMLKLLQSFPGSYLVRAQAGDLRYMLAFTTPAAAVAWGLSLQEAALYLPYPQQVLGLGSFGVQLDESGRLVFRGPRFKMGLSQGTPKVILPDHLGRADYHGSFVNGAARFASVAAQGGQLVTDADLARQVLASWKAHNRSSGSIAGQLNSSSAGHLSNNGSSAGHLNGSSTGSLAAAGAGASSSNGANRTPNISRPRTPQQQQQLAPYSPMVQQALPPPAPAATAAAAGRASSSIPRMSDPSSNSSSQGLLAPKAPEQLPAAAAAAGVGRTARLSDSSIGTDTTRTLALLDDAPAAAPSAAAAAAAAAGAAAATAAGAHATTAVAVDCCWLGSFLFKGNPLPVSMVSFSAEVLAGRHYAAPAVASNKGVRVLQRVGVMDRAVVQLPAAVEGFGPWERVSSLHTQ